MNVYSFFSNTFFLLGDSTLCCKIFAICGILPVIVVNFQSYILHLQMTNLTGFLRPLLIYRVFLKNSLQYFILENMMDC